MNEPTDSSLGHSLVLQEREGVGLLHRVEVLTLNILDQRQLEGHGVVHLADCCVDLRQPGYLARSPTTFTVNDLEALAHRPHHDRFKQAIGLDAPG